jgi:hypothetical protein
MFRHVKRHFALRETGGIYAIGKGRNTVRKDALLSKLVDATLQEETDTTSP